MDMHPGGSSGKILFVINSLAGGGAERVMMTLLQGSHARFADRPFALALLDDDPEAYAPPAWLPVSRLSTQGSLLRGLRSFRALVRRERPDLIVSFLTRANAIAAIVGRLERVPTVISERINTSAHLAGRKALPSRWLVRLTYPLADRIIAVSQGVASDLSRNFGVAAGRVTTIANPVDVGTLAAKAAADVALPVRPPFLVAVGRLTEAKNMILLVRAYADAGVDTPLLILGDGPEREKLSAEISSLGLSQRITLGGFVDNPFAILRHARAYVSASNGEGFPNALVEAMALRLPVLVTNCASGPSEILADREREAVAGVLDTPFGRLIPTNDGMALAEGLRWIDGLAETALTNMGDRGAARAREFSPELAVERYWRVFDDVMGNGHPQHR